tara:strand:- start:18 stop:743 length:726 start_codon:yes stop_codon:yes gene_type:complete
MALPNILKPKFQAEMIRVGGDSDGAYLVGINSIIQAKNLISYGIHDDWRFEKNFHTLNKSCNLSLYDDILDFSFLVIKLLKQLVKFFLFKKNYLGRSIKNIFSYFFFCRGIYNKKKIKGSDVLSNEKLSEIFFKIDIEGSEYELLNNLIIIQDKIVGLVIEFHDLDKNIQKVINFIKNFKLDLIHIHPNNFGVLDKNLDPTVIELTFEKNSNIISLNYIHPNKLDINNNLKNEEIFLKFKN